MTLSPKQREIRRRESRILELARPAVASGGLAALSMEELAGQLGTAKGTIYNHFPNKEEIVLALAVEAVDRRLDLFNQAVMLRGSSRQRIAAIGIACEVYVDRLPDRFRAEQLIRHETVWGENVRETPRDAADLRDPLHAHRCRGGPGRDRGGRLGFADPGTRFGDTRPSSRGRRVRALVADPRGARVGVDEPVAGRPRDRRFPGRDSSQLQRDARRLGVEAGVRPESVHRLDRPSPRLARRQPAGRRGARMTENRAGEVRAGEVRAVEVRAGASRKLGSTSDTPEPHETKK